MKTGTRNGGLDARIAVAIGLDGNADRVGGLVLSRASDREVVERLVIPSDARARTAT